MITKEFTNLNSQPTKGVLNTRLLGTLGILASPMLLLEDLLTGFQPHETDQLIGLLGVIYTTGWICSIIGLYSSKATGKSRLGKAILVIQLIGLFLAAAWAAYHMVVLNPNTDHWLYQATDIAWPLSHLFMIVVGIATLRAKTWTSWRRFTPLLGGLALPVAIMVSIVAGEEAMGIIFSVWTTVAFALLGYAVRPSNDS